MIRRFIYLFFLLMLFACDPWQDNPLDMNHSITVSNSTQCNLIVSLDDQVTISLPEPGSFDVFHNVSQGIHSLIVYDNSLSPPSRLFQIEINVSERKDYFWHINTCESDD